MSIYQRNGTWHIDLTVPGHPRVRRSACTADKKAAQELHDRLRAQLWRTAQLGESPERVFDDAALVLLELSQGQSDYNTKVRHVEYWREALGSRAPLRSLTVDVVMSNLPTHTTHPNRKPTPVSPATKNRYVATIRRMLNLAFEREWVDRPFKAAAFREPKKRVRWEPQHTIRHLIEVMSLEWMRDVCTVAVVTGMREDELLSMEPRHVDLRTRQAHVEADQAKSGYARSVPLNDDAMRVFERRIPMARKYIFERPSRDGKIRQIGQTDARCFSRACALVGIQDFHFHDLRHTWASWHVQSGTPLMVLKELGGWETMEMVQRYAHLAPSHLAHHADRVTFTSQSDEDKKKAA